MVKVICRCWWNIKKIEGLSDANLVDLSYYIDFLNYRTNRPELFKAETLLDLFRQYRVFCWKDLATAIRESGIEKSGGGYMDRSAVVNWISLNYFIERDKAEDALRILQEQDLVRTSYNGNIN